MDEYMAFVYTIVHGKLSAVCGKPEIEECVSDVFFKLYTARSIIDPDKGSLKSYLAVLSRRAAIDVFRKTQNRAGSVSFDELENEWGVSDADVEKSVIDRETGELLIQEIKALGEPDTEILIRKYYFGQSSKIISKTLGIKENTVNKRISRALVKLKGALGGVL